MKKSLFPITIFVLAIVSIILALPFTPLRNFSQSIVNDYVDRTLTEMGVDINGKIKNTRLITELSQYEAFGFNIPANFNNKKKVDLTGNYIVSNENNSENPYLELRNLKTSESNVMGVGSEYGSLISKSGINSKTNVQNIGFRSTSTSSTSQNAGTIIANSKSYDEGQGGTHPGLDPDVQLGNLPIGDGNLLMLTFCLFFVFYKLRKI
jgi:hypothetical protein